jgi:ABC-type long-subunit fatty acid transport system fused permease/ATPase subunit
LQALRRDEDEDERDDHREGEGGSDDEQFDGARVAHERNPSNRASVWVSNEGLAMISALFTLLIYLVILGILYWAVDFAIANIPIQEPIARFIRIILVVIFALILISLLLGLIGVAPGIDLPRLR